MYAQIPKENCWEAAANVWVVISGLLSVYSKSTACLKIQQVLSASQPNLLVACWQSLEHTPQKTRLQYKIPSAPPPRLHTTGKKKKKTSKNSTKQPTLLLNHHLIWIHSPQTWFIKKAHCIQTEEKPTLYQRRNIYIPWGLQTILCAAIYVFAEHVPISLLVVSSFV